MTKLEKLLDEHGHYWFMAAAAKRRPDAFRGGAIKAGEEIIALVREMLKESFDEGSTARIRATREGDWGPEGWDIERGDKVDAGLNTPAEGDS